MKKSPPEPKDFQDIALEIGVDTAFVEKDWYAVQLVSAIEAFNQQQDIQAVFSGGTSLSKGYQLIQRFSEDLDFILIHPEHEKISRGKRRKFREELITYIRNIDSYFSIDNEPSVSNNSQFFRAQVIYPLTQRHKFLRPHLQLEMSFHMHQVEPLLRPIQSIVARITGREPEAKILCISPLETAADKFSALVWRVLSRGLVSTNYDPVFIRHLHDLAILSDYVQKDFELFAKTTKSNFQEETRGGEAIHSLPISQQISNTLKTLQDDGSYEREYSNFVVDMSYADDDKRLSFSRALSRFEQLAKQYLSKSEHV